MNQFLRVCARIVTGKLLPRVSYPVLRGPLRGARFVLGSLSGEGGGATVYLNMMEPEQTATLVSVLARGDVLFDIGANVGYYSILAARCVGAEGRVLAIEPVIRNVALLHRHVSLNEASNVTVIAAACSDSVAMTGFSAGSNFATGHLTDGMAPVAMGAVTPVPTVTVDTLVEQVGRLPDVMKIDVEGAELAVLRGAEATLRKRQPTILLSTHSDELRVTCLRFLQRLDYVCEPLGADTDAPSEFVARPSGGSTSRSSTSQTVPQSAAAEK